MLFYILSIFYVIFNYIVLFIIITVFKIYNLYINNYFLFGVSSSTTLVFNKVQAKLSFVDTRLFTY